MNLSVQVSGAWQLLLRLVMKLTEAGGYHLYHCCTMIKRFTVFAPQRRSYLVVLALLMLVLVLAACGQDRSPATLPVQPTAAVLAAQPTEAAAAALPAAPDVTPTPAATQTSAALPTATPSATPTATQTPTPTATPIFPLSIEYLRQQDYSGSELVIDGGMNAI